MNLGGGITSGRRSLEEVHGSITIPSGRGSAPRLRRFFAFLGPAYLVSIGYMDPGNWATDLQGGARFGYALIWVLLMSNMMAILLQTLAARLGVVTGHDLAQACRAEYSRGLNAVLWVLAEVAIAACDLAEILGTVIALKLLFGIPLLWGCIPTAFDTFLLLYLQRFGIRRVEAIILALIGTIGICFVIQIFLAKPDLAGIASGLRPTLPPGSLYIAIGILGATVMPHNLYLHSALVQTRRIGADAASKSVRMPLLSARRGHRAQHCIFRQRGDSDCERCRLWPTRAGRRKYRTGLSAPSRVPRPGCTDPFWCRTVMRRPKLDLDGDPGGPDRDGGLSQHAHGALAAPADHAADRPACPPSW